MTVVTRKTRETDIRVGLTREPRTPSVIETGRPFLDHMLATLARYSGVGLDLSANGDLPHHIIEDTAIALGAAFAEMAPATAARFGEATVPMDDALVQVVVDIGGRAFYRGPLPSKMYDHWMRSFADSARATIHIRVLRGRDRHHIVEASFKALGLALRAALAESGAVFSTKGSVSLEVVP
jgi:imidazoleglycerol-phosphate dehydratase